MQNPSNAPALRQALKPLIETHGLLQVLRAALAANGALRRDARRAKNPGDLTPHLRRDIGLPPEAPPGKTDWQSYR